MHDALGETRGSGGVHDEHRVVRIHLPRAGGEGRIGHRVGLCQGAVPRCRPGILAIADDHDSFELREVRIGQDVALGQRNHLADHVQVVHRPGDVVGDQRRAIRLAHHVFEVVGAEAGVDRHVHGADLGQREHQEQPRGPIVEPQGDMIPALHAERHQRLRRPVDLVPDICERVALVLEDQRFAISEASRHVVGKIAETALWIPFRHGASLQATPRRF